MASRHPGLTLLIGVLLVAVFIGDLLLPLGVAAGVPYVAPTLLALWLGRPRALIIVALISTTLTVAGYFLSDPGASDWAVIPNRALAIGAVWVVAVMGIRRHRLERRLSESEALARAVLASTADGILTVDEAGVILTSNSAAQAISGYDEAALLGSSIGMLLRPDSAPDDHHPQSDDWRNDLERIHDAVLQRRDGSRLSVEILTMPIEHENGGRYTVTVRDVSRRRLFERDVLQLQEAQRREIGYGLHERLGQALTGLHLMSRNLARRLEARGLPEAEDAAELAAQLNEADMLALELFDGLSPIDARGGFAAAIRHAIAEVASQAGVECAVNEYGDGSDVESHNLDALYRVGLELVQESIRHTSPARMRVELGSEGRPLALTLVDVAIESEEQWSEALDRIRFRTRLADGHLRVRRSDPDQLFISIDMMPEPADGRSTSS